MLSDEEKKAVDKIKTLIQYLNVWKENFTIVPKDVKYLVTILNLIEKQSKEIEELKEQCKEVVCVPEGTCFMIEPKDVDKKWEDKIKAKIEDLKENSNGDDFNLTNVIMLFKSLLEKE